MANKQIRRGVDLFAGTEKLRGLMQTVGMVVTNFGGVEDTLRYLHWQLKAFALADPMLQSGVSPNDIQIALDAERKKYFIKFMVLSKILKGIDQAVAAPAVKAVLGVDEPVVSKRWASLKASAEDLGKRRNELAHSVLALSGVSPVRVAGLMEPAHPFKPEDDEKLSTEIGAFGIELGEFINDLTPQLPFRDHNKVIFASVTLAV